MKRIEKLAEDYAAGNFVPRLGETEFGVIERAFEAGYRQAIELMREEASKDGVLQYIEQILERLAG